MGRGFKVKTHTLPLLFDGAAHNSPFVCLELYIKASGSSRFIAYSVPLDADNVTCVSTIIASVIVSWQMMTYNYNIEVILLVIHRTSVKKNLSNHVHERWATGFKYNYRYQMIDRQAVTKEHPISPLARYCKSLDHQ